jgi:hypothetical protein
VATIGVPCHVSITTLTMHPLHLQSQTHEYLQASIVTKKSNCKANHEMHENMTKWANIIGFITSIIMSKHYTIALVELSHYGICQTYNL